MSETSLENDARSRRWWRRPWVWVAVLVVLVVAVAAVGLIGYRKEQQDPLPAAPAPSVNKPSVPSSGPTGDYAGSDVDVLGRGMRIPTSAVGHVLPQEAGQQSPNVLKTPLAAPAGLEWQKVYGIPLPFSTGDGPAAIDSAGVPSGFSRSPQGAALASLQLLFRCMYGPAAQCRAVLDTATVGGDPGLRQWIIEHGNASGAPGQTIPAALQITPDTYTSSTAFVRWAFGPFPAPQDHPTASGYVYTTLAIPMVWDSGEWKLRLGEWVRSTDSGYLDAIDEAGWSTWF